jgi:hypothetical protein
MHAPLITGLLHAFRAHFRHHKWCTGISRAVFGSMALARLVQVNMRSEQFPDSDPVLPVLADRFAATETPGEPRIWPRSATAPRPTKDPLIVIAIADERFLVGRNRSLVGLALQLVAKVLLGGGDEARREQQIERG